MIKFEKVENRAKKWFQTIWPKLLENVLKYRNYLKSVIRSNLTMFFFILFDKKSKSVNRAFLIFRFKRLSFISGLTSIYWFSVLVSKNESREHWTTLKSALAISFAKFSPMTLSKCGSQWDGRVASKTGVCSGRHSPWEDSSFWKNSLAQLSRKRLSQTHRNWYSLKRPFHQSGAS